jgi:N-acetylneuraminic acid mutarotase
VAIKTVIYLFGGLAEGDRRQNGIRSYNTKTRVWTLLKPTGQSPSGRAGSCGWVEGVFLYFFGGKIDSSSLPGGEMADNCTNQVARFNTKTKTWSDVRTSGARPTPRCGAGLAKLRGEVYVMGGIDGKYKQLDDVRILDLKTFAWTELRPRGPSPGDRYIHSFTAVSPNLILLVGGWNESSHLRDVWTLDTENQTWKR